MLCVTGVFSRDMIKKFLFQFYTWVWIAGAFDHLVLLMLAVPSLTWEQLVCVCICVCVHVIVGFLCLQPTLQPAHSQMKCLGRRSSLLSLALFSSSSSSYWSSSSAAGSTWWNGVSGSVSACLGLLGTQCWPQGVGKHYGKMAKWFDCGQGLEEELEWKKQIVSSLLVSSDLYICIFHCCLFEQESDPTVFLLT